MAPRRIGIFLVLLLTTSIVTLIIVQPVVVNAALREYSKKYDAGRDILVLSPSNNIVFIREGEELVFRVMVFSEDVVKVSITVCNKVFDAKEVSNTSSSVLPRIFEARIPVKYTDIYSWKIIVHYRNGLTLSTCTGRLFIVVSEEEPSLLYKEIRENVWITPSIA